jgi:hypothetical protein
MASGAQLSKSERQSDCESLSTLPGSPRKILQGGTRLLLDPQRQSETSLKGPIALDFGRFSHDLGYAKIFDILS